VNSEDQPGERGDDLPAVDLGAGPWLAQRPFERIAQQQQAAALLGRQRLRCGDPGQRRGRRSSRRRRPARRNVIVAERREEVEVDPPRVDPAGPGRASTSGAVPALSSLGMSPAREARRLPREDDQLSAPVDPPGPRPAQGLSREPGRGPRGGPPARL